MYETPNSAVEDSVALENARGSAAAHSDDIAARERNDPARDRGGGRFGFGGTIRAVNRCPGHIYIFREIEMDWNRVEGNWKQVKGKVKEKWGNLTDDDLTAINGRRDQLEGKIQERYGLAKDKVRTDVDDWYNAQTW
jgi:uncharacterized protein YjbJ (UPF0337 family)